MPYAERDGTRIFWEAEGQGEPVLLIMGLGYPAAMWYRVIPFLSDRYRTIRFDNRGTGSTGVVPGPYSIEGMAQDAAAVLEAAGEESAHVVGISMGGFIAQELVLGHPERVRSLVLACTSMNGPEAAPPSAEAVEMMARRADMTPAEAAEAAVPFVYAPDTDRALIDEDFAVRLRQPTSPEGYARQLAAVMGHGGTYARLPEIDAPTLVVHGTADRLVDPANAPRLAGRIRGARLEMLEGASHIIVTDRPAETGRLLRAFLDAAGA